MKQLKSYINIRKQTGKSSIWKEFLDTLAKYNDNVSYIQDVGTILNKIGQCEILDIMTKGIINVLETNDYELKLDDISDITNYKKNYVMIGVNPSSDFSSFDVYSPYNEHVKLIHINIHMSSSDPYFDIFLVAWLDDEEFIRKYSGDYDDEDLDEDGESWVVSKSNPDKRALERLQRFFEQIIK